MFQIMQTEIFKSNVAGDSRGGSIKYQPWFYVTLCLISCEVKGKFEILINSHKYHIATLVE